MGEITDGRKPCYAGELVKLSDVEHDSLVACAASLPHGAAGPQLNESEIRRLDARRSRIVAALTDRTATRSISINVDRSPDRNDVEERLDVLVPKPDAAVTDRSANG